MINGKQEDYYIFLNALNGYISHFQHFIKSDHLKKS